MNIDCPYCEKEVTFETCDIGSSSAGEEIEVSCNHCDRTFFARLNIDVYLDDARKCDCLDNRSLCEMERKENDLSFLGLPVMVHYKCKNCGRMDNRDEPR